MTAGVLWCWLAVGLFVLADPRRATRVLTGAHRATIALRCAGTLLLAVGAQAIARELGISLGIVVFLLSLTAVLSVASLSFSLRPRAYAATLPAATIIALAHCLG